MQFEFATATRIMFGQGKARDAAPVAASFGRHALVITGSTPARLDFFVRELQAQNVKYTQFSIAGEPSIPGVLDGLRAAKDAECDLVIGCGGGSVLDGAKAIAALLTNPGDPLDYLEVVGKGKPLTRPCAPCICIPTTAGTGCEVTRNSVLVSPEHRVKVSLRSPWMLPSLAVIDPALTYSLPPAITASTGMDALAQLIESFVCRFTNPMTDALCRDGISRASRWLRVAYADGNNAVARENMALASLFGGLALANAGLGVVHGLAAPLGGMFPVPHGMVCALLLPIAMHANLRALKARAKESPALPRYEEIARLLTGKSSARAGDGIEWVQSMCMDMSVPRFAGFGIAANDLPDIAERAQKTSSIKGNPVELTAGELVDMLQAAL